MKDKDTIILESLYGDIGKKTNDETYINLIKAQNYQEAQKMIDNDLIKMNRKIFNSIDVRPENTQIATTIHKRLLSSGAIADEFKDGRGLVYGDGRGAASAHLGAHSYEPFPPKNFKPTFAGDRSGGKGTNIDNKYDIILNTFVLNVVDLDTREFIVKDIANLLNVNGKAVIVTRGKDVLNSKPYQVFGPMEVLTKKVGNYTYQKGYTQDELVSYLKYTLGSSFDVHPIKGGGSGDVRAVFVKNSDVQLINPIPTG